MSTQAFAPTFQPYNVFLPEPARAVPMVSEATTAEPCYALVQSGPAVAAEEVESHIDAVEVTVRWGVQVMAVSHIDGRRGTGFSLGESGADFVMPEDVLGTEHASIVERRGESVVAFVPQRGTAVLSARGEADVAVAGGTELTLPANATLAIALGDFAIEVKTVRAGKRLPVSFLTALASGAAAFVGLSALGHAAIVASMAMFMPSMGSNDADAIDRDQILQMQKLLSASAERELTPPEPVTGPEADAAGGGSTGGEPHKGESGAAGTQTSNNKNGRMAFKGNDAAPALSHAEEKALAENFGIIGLMNAGATGNTASPWAKEDPLGSDPVNKAGQMFGTNIDDAAGFGLGLWGTGEGGGGNGAGIGIDGIGDHIGGGGKGPGKWGIGRGDKDGIGNGHGPGGGHHVTKAPIMRTPQIDTNGRLPPEVIQRIVRQNFGRFRLCYEGGLRTNPGLTGRVATKFAIGRDGSVMTAQDAGSDMPDQAVTQCIVKSFQALSFPQPEGGIATVTYPIVFAPGE